VEKFWEETRKKQCEKFSFFHAIFLAKRFETKVATSQQKNTRRRLHWESSRNHKKSARSLLTLKLAKYGPDDRYIIP